MLKKILEKFHIFHNIYIKHKYLIKKESYSMEEEDLIILELTKDLAALSVKVQYLERENLRLLELNNQFLTSKNLDK